MVVEDEAGRAVIPSVVYVRKEGCVLVGEEALAAARSDPDPTNAYFGVKRLMGRSYREALSEVEAEEGTEEGEGEEQPLRRRRLRPYALVEGAGGRAEVDCPALGRSLAPQEVSSHLLRHLVGRAQAFLQRQCSGGGGQEAQEVRVLDAVVTVPAHFSPGQRAAVLEATRAAGLQRVTLLQEPIAAAMAYGFGSAAVPYDLLLVLDVGGGTTDLTIVEAFDGIMEVLATSGDNYLGGDDFTALVADWLTAQQQQQQGRQGQVLVGSGPVREAAPSTSSHPSSMPSRSPTSTSLPSSPSSSSSLSLLLAAEAAKTALSRAVAEAEASTSAAPASSGSSSSIDGGAGCGGGGRVRVRVPLPGEAGGGGGGQEVELSEGAFEELT
ncbi:Stromal heat shock-related protein, chloroplastic, partial [Tetrabaena socialis]